MASAPSTHACKSAAFTACLSPLLQSTTKALRLEPDQVPQTTVKGSPNIIMSECQIEGGEVGIHLSGEEPQLGVALINIPGVRIFKTL